MVAWFPQALHRRRGRLDPDRPGERDVARRGRIYRHDAKSPAIIGHDGGRPERVVFARMRDPVSGTWGYRLAGVFAYAGIGLDAHGVRSEAYRRTGGEWKIVR